MEPIKINIEVEVGLKQTTIDTIRQLFGAQIVAQPAAEAPAPKDEPKRKAKKETEAPAPQPKTEAVEAPKEEIPALAADDDLPPDDAPAPTQKSTPSEDDARQAVKAARTRGVSAKAIKEFMKEGFDIASSVECPAERRQELIDGLNQLAA